ncbi:MAG TPA: endolytic transglycosylase MltG [Anaerolineales bacterium]|nr:endolytic transglycosylase MltG [Anaerolineales bacterium]
MPHRAAYTGLLLLVIALVFCAGIGLSVWLAFNLPRQAAAVFGPPDPGLNPLDRIKLSAQLLLQSDMLTKAVDPTGSPRGFEVDLGESLPSIANRLQQEGLISDAQIFRTYLQYAGLDTTLQAGKYSLSPAMTPLEIAHLLQDATPSEVVLTILPGWRLEEIAATLPTSGLEFSPQEFLDASRERAEGFSFLEDLPPSATLEGLLFPGTYQLPRKASPEETLVDIMEAFGETLTSEIQAGFERQGLDLYAAVTLASIVEKESIDAAEMPLIASVFLNRLAVGMRLDADSTVQYALGYNEQQKTWWTNPLSASDLQVDSPFNTYIFSGLPPSPIANPSLNSMRAVAFPAQTPYYFFRAACDGSGKHLFAETYEEHVQNSCP